MPNFSIKLHLGRLVGVLRWQLDVDLEATAFVCSIIWTLNVPLPMSDVPVKERDLDSGFLGLS